jgi:erythromycin esterase
MKNFVCCCFCLFLPDYLISQVNVTIGTQETPIYPIFTEKKDLSEQLQPLKALFSSKSIIGMGEATHGTREFFEIKGGMFQWLVNECNYRVFGIEATYGGCCYINDFVQSGEGTLTV